MRGAMLHGRAILLVTLRVCDWIVLIRLRSIALGVGIALSSFLVFVVLRTEPDRRTWIPPSVVALLQVGVVCELCEFCERRQRSMRSQTTRKPTSAVELVCNTASDNPSSRPSKISTVSYSTTPLRLYDYTASDESPRTPGNLLVGQTNVSSNEDSFILPESARTPWGNAEHAVPSVQLRQRVLRKMMVAQVPEAVVSTIWCFWAVLRCFKDENEKLCELLVRHSAHGAGWAGERLSIWNWVEFNAHRVGRHISWNWVLLVSTVVFALIVLSVGLADIVVWIWIQTDFVKEHRYLVVLFYLLEVCSWVPAIVALYIEMEQHGMREVLRFVGSGLVLLTLLIVLGFCGKPRKLGGPSTWLRRGVYFCGLIVLAIMTTPLVVFVNLVFFDRSTTFRHLNNWYYAIRFGTVSAIMAIHFRENFSNDLACMISICASILLAIMVWVVVPRLRHLRERRTAEEFAQITTREPEGSVTHNDNGSFMVTLAAAGPRNTAAPLMGMAPPFDSRFVAVLNVVGDTFESLLLASSADSPRVRCAVLGVAINPLQELGKVRPDLLRQLLPLILPQLLLAIRWRTVDDGQDEHCPLSRFILDSALTANSLPLVTMVYWQLLALSTDRSEDTPYLTYRSMRQRLLLGLQETSFNDIPYDEDFCNKALKMLSTQCRVYYQMRTVAKTAASVQGSHTEKTAMLRTALSSFDYFKRWKGTKCLPPRRRNTVTLDHKSLQAKRCCGMRTCLTACCSWAKPSEASVDIVREEWEKDTILHEYENMDLILLEPHGCLLPVDPTEAIAGVDENRSFVAHSAVAPSVLCCKMAGPEGKADALGRRRLFALKHGDDLRQDALVLQIFKFMETAWAEHGLADVTLRPYNVLAVSPQEGIVAFVPRAEKVSSILLQYEGDVRQFVSRNTEDVERSFDRLCGSAAGYCVATYLLGVGDRHLDNLMITEDGHFFHIDFGYVLGDDPKPGAPPVRMPREVIDAIRATNRYDHFKNLVGDAFSLLRRTARLWTSLLLLTKQAGGNGVSALRPGGDEHGIHIVRRRLLLDLDDEAARKEIIAEVEASVASVLPVVFDKLHQVGLFWH